MKFVYKKLCNIILNPNFIAEITIDDFSKKIIYVQE
jgi:hypothetical protein